MKNHEHSTNFTFEQKQELFNKEEASSYRRLNFILTLM